MKKLIKKIQEPNYSACRKFLKENNKLLDSVYGSTHNHQTWPGGYLDHVTETMNIANLLYKCLNSKRKLTFTLSDALLVLFLHDIKKPWKYRKKKGELIHKHHFMQGGKKTHHTFRLKIISKYGFKLKKEQQIALKYVEGELDDYSNKYRVTNALGAFCNLCDLTSSRIWYDFPKNKKLQIVSISHEKSSVDSVGKMLL